MNESWVWYVHENIWQHKGSTLLKCWYYTFGFHKETYSCIQSVFQVQNYNLHTMNYCHVPVIICMNLNKCTWFKIPTIAFVKWNSLHPTKTLYPLFSILNRYTNWKHYWNIHPTSVDIPIYNVTLLCYKIKASIYSKCGYVCTLLV